VIKPAKIVATLAAAVALSGAGLVAGADSASAAGLCRNNVYHWGDRGECVRAFQALTDAKLDTYAAYQGTRYQLVHDGVYGAKTYDAVTKLQRKKGLVVDGVVGPKTWRALCNGGWQLKNSTVNPYGTTAKEFNWAMDRACR
jgi:peptidoglycan hydrolase-like protein with peptidoglycan-binding domain